VSSGGGIVKKVGYPPPKIVVFHDDEGMVFSEVVVGGECKAVFRCDGDK
jgi:hypothetical protein